MVYGRLSAGVIRLVPSTAPYEGKMFTNPPAEFLEDNSWKPVVFVLQPPGEGWEMHWMEETNCIVQVWSQSSSSNQVSEPTTSEDPNTPASDEEN